MILAMKYIKLAALGIWLLIVIWFEDTSDWSRERLLLARRSFAVVMVLAVIFSLFFTIKALGQQPEPTYYTITNRLNRIESRQDFNFEEHAKMKERLAVVESISQSNATSLDRLIWGVIGLTIASIGQLLVALFRLKMGGNNGGHL